MRRSRKRKLSFSLKSLPDFRSGVNLPANTEDSKRARGQSLESLKKKRRVIAVSLAAFFAIGGFIYLNSINMVSVVISTDETAYVPLNEESVLESAEGYIDESFINKWFVNKGALEARVKTRNQAVESVEILGRSGRDIEISVSARKKAVVWQQDDKYFEVDTSAIAFRGSSKNKASKSVLVKDQTRIPVELDKPVAPGAFIKAVSGLVEANGAQSKPYNVEFYVSPPAPRELHFKLVNRPYTVKVRIDQNPDIIIASLNDTLHHFKSRGINPGAVIDLRVDGRAVWR